MFCSFKSGVLIAAAALGAALSVAPAAIRDTHILKTWVGGVEVYDSESTGARRTN
jgi:O-antigen ligase